MRWDVYRSRFLNDFNWDYFRVAEGKGMVGREVDKWIGFVSASVSRSREFTVTDRVWIRS